MLYLLFLGQGIEGGQQRGHQVFVHVAADAELGVDLDLGLLDGLLLRLTV